MFVIKCHSISMGAGLAVLKSEVYVVLPIRALSKTLDKKWKYAEDNIL